MSQYLLKKAKLYDRRSSYHLQTVDILIKDGRIVDIAEKITAPEATEIKSKELSVSPGWLDVGCYNGEPGYEQREELSTLKSAAAAGGYIYLATLPLTDPVVSTKAQVQYLQRRNDEHAVELIPIAAATQGAKGQDIAELIDLTEAGVIAFSDGPDNQISKGQLMRILEYLKVTDAQYIHYLRHNTLALHGQINEGTQSMRLGLEGLPREEEHLHVSEAVQIAEYAGRALCIHNISTEQSYKLIEKSKQAIKTAVPYLNLIKTDEDVADFDTSLKVLPPLRTKKDKKALTKLIRKGKINCISSNHWPHRSQDKDKEFGLAEYGATGIQTCYSALNTHLEDIEQETLIHCLSQGSYEYLNLRAPLIETGAVAQLTIFDPSIPYQVNHLASKARNNPFYQAELTGKVIAIINGEKSSIVDKIN